MHRVVLWVEQGRQVVDSQLVCTTPAAGLRVMLANHSRSGGCTFAIRNRYLSVPLARCVHHSRRKICTFYKFMAEANPIDRSRALGGCRRCGRGAFCFSPDVLYGCMHMHGGSFAPCAKTPTAAVGSSHFGNIPLENRWCSGCGAVLRLVAHLPAAHDLETLVADGAFLL